MGKSRKLFIFRFSKTSYCLSHPLLGFASDCSPLALLLRLPTRPGWCHCCHVASYPPDPSPSEEPSGGTTWLREPSAPAKAKAIFHNHSSHQRSPSGSQERKAALAGDILLCFPSAKPTGPHGYSPPFGSRVPLLFVLTFVALHMPVAPGRQTLCVDRHPERRPSELHPLCPPCRT